MTPSATPIARVCHEANRAYCLSLGDDSQVDWANAPGWQQESAVVGVQGILDGTTATPEQSHESWMAHKLAGGWKYGPVKDPEKLEHPCLVPYAELPEEQRRKDALFFAIVEALGRQFNEATATPTAPPYEILDQPEPEPEPSAMMDNFQGERAAE